MHVYPRHGDTAVCRVIEVHGTQGEHYGFSLVVQHPEGPLLDVNWVSQGAIQAPWVNDRVEIIANVISKRGRPTSWSWEFCKKVEERDMAMSKDRVRFELGSGYYMPHSDNARRITAVMVDSFGENCQRWSRIFRDNPDGLTIVCRPSQFARFMIYRNAAGIQNGFKDLHAELLPEPPDPLDGVAKVVGIPAKQVRRVLSAVNVDIDELDIDGADWIDVSKNPRQCV